MGLYEVSKFCTNFLFRPYRAPPLGSWGRIDRYSPFAFALRNARWTGWPTMRLFRLNPESWRAWPVQAPDFLVEDKGSKVLEAGPPVFSGLPRRSSHRLAFCAYLGMVLRPKGLVREYAPRTSADSRSDLTRAEALGLSAADYLVSGNVKANKRLQRAEKKQVRIWEESLREEAAARERAHGLGLCLDGLRFDELKDRPQKYWSNDPPRRIMDKREPNLYRSRVQDLGELSGQDIMSRWQRSIREAC